MIRDFELAKKNMARLNEAGVSFALDDYGSGYSNWRRLIDLPFEVLKIDGSLTEELETNAKAQTVFESVVELSTNLGLSIVSEKVETTRQIEIVRDAGSDFIQGCAVSKPMSVSDTEDWLQSMAIKKSSQSSAA